MGIIHGHSLPAPVFLCKILLVLRTVHACKIEHKVTLLAACIQLFRRRVKVIFIYLLDSKAMGPPILSLFGVLQCCTKVFTRFSGKAQL